MSTTAAQPTPISRRLAPVMFAIAYECASSSPCPARNARMRSTAYSGRTAISARTAIASVCEMSSWATSAAQARRKAAPRIAAPYTAVSHTRGTWMSSSRAAIPGMGPNSASRKVARNRLGRSAGTEPKDIGPGRFRVGNAWEHESVEAKKFLDELLEEEGVRERLTHLEPLPARDPEPQPFPRLPDPLP